MGGSSIGSAFRVVTFGESHGPAVGAVIEGVRPGLAFDVEIVRRELARRRPGVNELVSPRSEADEPEILSGVFEGRTTGAPICIVVRNHDAIPSEYDGVKDLFRPGHGDFSWLEKYGIRDHRGGGRQSGRETVGRVAAGALARVVLAQTGTVVRGRVVEIAGIEAAPVAADEIDWDVVVASPVRCADPVAGAAMVEAIRKAAGEGESVGGVVEVVASGVPAGLGEPVFGKLDAEIARALMSIGAVKGVEIGEGFRAARMIGSKMVDQMATGGCLTNHAGGILAGVSNGMPIVCRVAVKPTPTVSGELRTVDLDGREVSFRREGRSDPCICPRLVPVAESMVSIVLADAVMSQEAVRGG
ncbi:chorismate synthase [Myxococcota bacterium]|nr:chorismate synthase [Myxococcota bacterium]